MEAVDGPEQTLQILDRSVLLTGPYTLLLSGAAGKLQHLALSVTQLFSQLVARATTLGCVEEILAYQTGSTDAYRSSVKAGRISIDSAYMNRVSVTHGPAESRQQQIWTFASALYDYDPDYNPAGNYPCTNTRYNWPYQLPSFTQNKYFCDTGNTGSSVFGGNTYYTADPLWDGAGCGADSTCCQFNNPPQSSLP